MMAGRVQQEILRGGHHASPHQLAGARANDCSWIWQTPGGTKTARADWLPIYRLPFALFVLHFHIKIERIRFAEEHAARLQIRTD